MSARVKIQIKRAIIIILLSFAGFVTHAQQAYSTQGRDFWLTFMQNRDAQQNSIIVTAEEGAEVHLTNASGTWSHTLTLAPMSSDSVEVHDEHGKGYHVTSDRDISVFASNYRSYSYDIATIYPTSTLRSRYMVQCYEVNELMSPNNYCHTSPEFTVLAVEDSTLVNILTPPDWQRTSFLLMAGETVEFDCNSPEHYITWPSTGTRIVADDCKPIAVFQGNMCTNVGLSTCDHLFEQAVPLDYWGKEFIVVPLAGREADDQVMITSASDMCNVSINGANTAVLNAGESLLLERHDLYHISTSQPVTACMYFTADYGNSNLGDPSSVILPPLDQGVQQSTFFAVSTDITTTEIYTNVVVKKSFVQGMTLDGMPVNTAFTAFDSTYSYAQLRVTPGTHTLACNHGRFQAIYYGMGSCESYAFVAAMGMQNIRLLVNGVEVDDVADICQGDSVTVEMVTDSSPHDIKWLLDGDSVGRSLTLPLHFADTGTHFLRATLHNNSCRRWSSNKDLILRVHPTYYSEETDSFCKGTPYLWRDTVLLTAGNYLDSLSTAAGCDSIFAISLTEWNESILGIEVDGDCYSHTYRLSTQHIDTSEWHNMQWSTVPDIPELHGHERDSVIELSPTAITYVTLHAEAECPTDSTITLKPITWPVAEMTVEPKLIQFDKQNSFEAYDISANTSSREWAVNGKTLAFTGNPLHYTIPEVSDSIVVVLTAMNDYCSDTASAVIHIINEGIYVPNVFTPGDDINNRFTIAAAEEIEGELTIYNRYGFQVFHTNDLATGWDGSSCAQGAYVWHLKYRYLHTPNRWQKAVGTVTLLR